MAKSIVLIDPFDIFEAETMFDFAKRWPQDRVTYSKKVGRWRGISYDCGDRIYYVYETKTAIKVKAM